ncbi:phosphoethanolamine transferase, partial [Pseudomonas aeruginosa]|nr:phosphoethanolamine transferase [Pseudomonas aeruginosa]
LGENGVYLHAAPYSIAPQAQIHVPMVMWFAPQALVNWGIQRSCLDGKRDDKDLSHDNLFHSVLVLLDVQTSLYQPALDIFASCRAPRAAQ